MKTLLVDIISGIILMLCIIIGLIFNDAGYFISGICLFVMMQSASCISNKGVSVKC